MQLNYVIRKCFISIIIIRIIKLIDITIVPADTLSSLTKQRNYLEKCIQQYLKLTNKLYSYTCH